MRSLFSNPAARQRGSFAAIRSCFHDPVADLQRPPLAARRKGRWQSLIADGHKGRGLNERQPPHAETDESRPEGQLPALAGVALRINRAGSNPSACSRTSSAAHCAAGTLGSRDSTQRNSRLGSLTTATW